MEQYIKLLDLPNSFDMSDLRTAYRKMAKKYHPDFATNDADRIKFTEKMKKINEANDELRAYLQRHGRYTKKTNTSSSTNKTKARSNTAQNNSNKSNTTNKTQHKKPNYNQQSNFTKTYYQSTEKEYTPAETLVGFLALCLIIYVTIACFKFMFSPTQATEKYTQQEQEQILENEPENEEVIDFEENIEETPEQEKVEKTNIDSTNNAIKQDNTSNKPQTEQVKLQPIKVTIDYPPSQTVAKSGIIYKSYRGLKDTDLGWQQPRERVQSADVKYYAQKLIAQIENNHPDTSSLGTDSLKLELYIDFYGELRYINITESPRTNNTAKYVKDLFSTITYRPPSYTKSGGDIKLTYRMNVANGHLDIQLNKAENLYY